MDIQLHSNGLDQLGPQWYRSPGIHGSTLIDRLCRRYRHYTDQNSLDDRHREMGKAFEDMIAYRLEQDHPGEYLHGPEIEVDGIYLTPDLVWIAQQADHEVKWTWMSPANGPEDLKMWKYLTQGQAYLYGLRRVAEGAARIRERVLREEDVRWQPAAQHPMRPDAYLTLYLTVGFANDFRPPQDQIPTWRIKFWPEELEMNWALMLDEKRRYIGEQEVAEILAQIEQEETAGT